MEPILDERSLVPCPVLLPPNRLFELAKTIQALDTLGATRVIRSTKDSIHQDIGDGKSLRVWCFDNSVDQVARQLLALRLGKQPFIDGNDGLFVNAEGTRVVEVRVDGQLALGVGLAVLTDGIVVCLISDANSSGKRLTADVLYLDEDVGETAESAQVDCLVTKGDVDGLQSELLRKIDAAVVNGRSLLERSSELFPRLILGSKAKTQIQELTGSETVFRQLLRHLRSLNLAAINASGDKPLVPEGISFSVESEATLKHGSFGPMRDFPVPEGFTQERWSLHTKLTGGNGSRLYFRGIPSNTPPVVLVGYFGEHLPTAKDRR